MNKSNIRWKDVPIRDVLNTKTDPIGDLLDATMKRLTELPHQQVENFLEGTEAKTLDRTFMTDLRTALVALSTLRNHF